MQSDVVERHVLSKWCITQMKAKIFGTLAVLAVLIGGIIFYQQATDSIMSPTSDISESTSQDEGNNAETQREALPPASATVSGEVDVLVNDLFDQTSADAASYTTDDENFVSDDAGDIDNFGSSITVQ